MNITLRKLALLESQMQKKEEAAKIAGYSTSPVDRDLKDRITKLMDRVRF